VTTDVTDSAANLLQPSMTPVVKLLPVLLIPLVLHDLQISLQIFNKIRKGDNRIIRERGKMMFEKTWGKNSVTIPFKWLPNRSGLVTGKWKTVESLKIKCGKNLQIVHVGVALWSVRPHQDAHRSIPVQQKKEMQRYWSSLSHLKSFFPRQLFLLSYIRREKRLES